MSDVEAATLSPHEFWLADPADVLNVAEAESFALLAEAALSGTSVLDVSNISTTLHTIPPAEAALAIAHRPHDGFLKIKLPDSRVTRMYNVNDPNCVTQVMVFEPRRFSSTLYRGDLSMVVGDVAIASSFADADKTPDSRAVVVGPDAIGAYIERIMAQDIASDRITAIDSRSFGLWAVATQHGLELPGVDEELIKIWKSQIIEQATTDLAESVEATPAGVDFRFAHTSYSLTSGVVGAFRLKTAEQQGILETAKIRAAFRLGLIDSQTERFIEAAAQIDFGMNQSPPELAEPQLVVAEETDVSEQAPTDIENELVWNLSRSLDAAEDVEGGIHFSYQADPAVLKAALNGLSSDRRRYVEARVLESACATASSAYSKPRIERYIVAVAQIDFGFQI